MPFKDLEKKKEYMKQYAKIWRSKNREKVKEISKRYYQNHIEEEQERKRKFYSLNREKEITRAMKGNILRYRKQRLEAIIHYGGDPPKCSCCGEDEYLFLTLHHINGNGSKHRLELKRSNTRLAEFLKKNNYPEGFGVLCYNCNCAKGFFGKCPHE